MKSFSFSLALVLVVGLMPIAYGSTNEFNAVTSGGLDGTDWLQYANKLNWAYPDRSSGYAQDDELGFGNAILDNCNGSSRGRYIELPVSLALHRLVAGTDNAKASWPVLRGDGVFKYVVTSADGNICDLNRIWLYSPYFLESSNGYGGIANGPLTICGPLSGTLFSSNANATDETGWTCGLRFGNKVTFDYSKFAMEKVGSTGIRTVDDWVCDYQLDRSGGVTFVSPCGSNEDIFRSFVLTDGSPFAKLAVGQPNDNLPVGTLVTGVGVDADTYLKRIFPDGSIELSKPATAPAETSELRFAAVSYHTTVVGTNSRLRVQNQTGERVVKVNKSRAEDDFEVQIKQLNHRLVGNSGTMTLTIATDDGFLPGRLRILEDSYKNPNETVANPLTVELEDCNLVPPARIRNEDVTFKSVTAKTARITVDTAGMRPSAGSYVMKFAEVKGTLVKDGIGIWNVAFTGTSADYSGSVIVEEGTLLVANANATLGTVEVKSGATFDVSAGGISVQNLIVADGAVISGGRVTATTITGDADKIVLKNGAAVIDATPSTESLEIELQSGAMRRMYEDGDCVVILTTNSVLRIDGTGTADILVVGGGGGAGSMTGGGGGGGGGVLYVQRAELVSGYYGVKVGLGGKGAVDRGVSVDADGHCYDGSCNGEDSIFNGLVALGGGAGGGYSGGGNETHPDSVVSSHVGVAGGSGGGGGVLYPANDRNRDQDGGAGAIGQGNAGARSYIRNHSPAVVCGGGGGGAGAAAVSPGKDNLGQIYGSNGGDGRLVPIWGNRYWGGGGAGSAASSVGVACVGGKGGGGDARIGMSECLDGDDGEPNTGGGGGAAATLGWDGKHTKGQRGGNGGSGVVIIRFKSKLVAPVVHDEPVAEGGQIRRRGGYAIHNFLADGIFTLHESTLADVLLVGGGGGGGVCGGGGGAGGAVQIISNIWIEAGAYEVTVGAGGLGQTSTGSAGYSTSGTGSRVNFGQSCDFAVPGGGYGGFRKHLLPVNVGGSGGGGGSPYGAASDANCWDPFIAGAVGVVPYGHAGGASTNWIDKTVEGYQIFKRYAGAGGGGGGAGGPGGNAWYVGIPSSSNRAQGGAGGAGVWCDFSGAMVEYGGGGDGGSAAEDTSAEKAIAGADGVPGTGKGGGGSTQGVDRYKKGGDGGCGCVIIRYLVRPRGCVLIVR